MSKCCKRGKALEFILQLSNTKAKEIKPKQSKTFVIDIKRTSSEVSKKKKSILAFWFAPLWICIMVYLVTWSNMTFPPQDSGSTTDVQLLAESSDIYY